MDRPGVMVILARLAVGCGRAEGDGDSAAGDDDDDDDGGSPDGVSPWIDKGQIQCTKGSQSSGYYFLVDVEADDPQGDETINLAGNVVAWEGAVLAFEEALLVCDDDGICTASWENGYYGGVTCSRSDDYSFEAQVFDEDGNASEACALRWIDSGD